MEHEDLGALLARITRWLIDAEQPLLEAHGLSMWAYIVLSQLARQPAETQLALAQAIRYDKTRLIGLLDELERDGLITRAADPRDRRARVVTLTEAGEARYGAARADIRAMEEEFLADLNLAERARLRQTLTGLALTAATRQPSAGGSSRSSTPRGRVNEKPAGRARTGRAS
jgi:DNA-binding MarR family transcriptional regulator